MQLGYKHIERMQKLYDLLEDDLSRKIFWARIEHDICDSVGSLIKISSLNRLLAYPCTRI